jgi:ribosomal protein S18 acetylase RimI-like enzyme
LIIRQSTTEDHAEIWKIFKAVVQTGDTYVYPPDCSQADAIKYWCEITEASFVAEVDLKIVGTYYLKPNQPGLGSHVCNTGYMVSETARGQGIATAMCLHSQQEALRRGYQAMQFNLVVCSNVTAINLWKKLGFQIVGEIPEAYNHKTLGLTDAFVMYKLLSQID